MKFISSLVFVSMLLFMACTGSKDIESEENRELQDSVQVYLDSYNKEYKDLYYAAAEAEWELNTIKLLNGDLTHQLREIHLRAMRQT